MSARAPFLRVTLRRLGHVVSDDVLCRRCFDALPAEARVASHDNRRGRTLEVKPWTGAPRCDSCEAGEVMRAMGFDPVDGLDARAEAAQDAMLRRQV